MLRKLNLFQNIRVKTFFYNFPSQANEKNITVVLKIVFNSDSNFLCKQEYFLTLIYCCLKLSRGTFLQETCFNETYIIRSSRL